MIKVFLCDVDATLTDGNYHMSEDGKLSKSFYTRDFHGLYSLNQSGVQVGIISYSRDKVIDSQVARAAKYVTLMTGVKDKKELITERYLPNFSWSEIAYIADDTFDIPLLEMVGFAACPSDAHPEVAKFIESRPNSFISSYNGGCGAVRDFADTVLALNALNKE